MGEVNGIKVSENVARVDSNYWHYYHRVPESDREITGKYLFFSESKDELERIAIDEIEYGGFYHAKINTDRCKRGDDYVLCLYYVDDSIKFELADKYKHNPKVKYRYWKSDEDTLKGKYSKQFLEQPSPKERKKWTRRKI